jgi:peptide/nickel transport system substrate-binding protein
VLVVVLLAAATGCSREPSATPAATSTPARGGALIASVRSEPSTYIRFVAGGSTAATDLLTHLTQARLVRVNRATDDLEPWLAESWTQSADGLSYTLKLRPGLKFSDGVPFTSADVLFSFRVVYDPVIKSQQASALMIAGKPLEVSAPDAMTVVVKMPTAFAPGLRLLDNLPVLPAHKLEAAYTAGRLAGEWVPSKPPSDVVGLGPFVLTEHVAGQRLAFARNPHYFRRDAAGVQLPYLDRLTLLVIPDQNTEALKLEAGETDLMANGDLRPQDHAAFKRLADAGKLKMTDVSVGLDPDFFAFNLRQSRSGDKRTWLTRREFRQAISSAVDRQAIVNTVYLGAAVPIGGPVTPGNRRWYSPDITAPPVDRERALKLLGSLGLADRNGDKMLDDASGAPVRFSVMTHAGHLRERVSAMIQEQLRQLGIGVDIVPLDPGGLFKRWSAGDYEAMYFGVQASSTEPALNPEFWFSSGGFHFWNPSQPSPATEWERRIDDLMREQASAADLTRRQTAFLEVQRILAEELPLIYFVAPRIVVATSTKVLNPTPAPQIPQLLWSADTLASSEARR